MGTTEREIDIRDVRVGDRIRGTWLSHVDSLSDDYSKVTSTVVEGVVDNIVYLVAKDSYNRKLADTSAVVVLLERGVTEPSDRSVVWYSMGGPGTGLAAGPVGRAVWCRSGSRWYNAFHPGVEHRWDQVVNLSETEGNGDLEVVFDAGE